MGGCVQKDMPYYLEFNLFIGHIVRVARGLPQDDRNLTLI